MKRTLQFVIRMTKDELQALDKKVKKTGMSREGYARCILNDKTPVEIPPAPYYDLIREVRALGNNMHQIAYKANTLNLLDAPLYRKKADMITALADKLTAVCLPRASGNMGSPQSGQLCGENEQPQSGEPFADRRKRRA